MPWTKRTYVLVAEALNGARRDPGPHGGPGAWRDADTVNGVLDELAEDFADRFENDNPNFDRARFMQVVYE